jgi:hypothetical protein
MNQVTKLLMQNPSLTHLTKLGIARETTGRNYGRIYAYDKYLRMLNEGTEPLD